MRYAVIFKTYQWTPFVERQALRCQKASGSGDFFVSVDETNGPLGRLPFPHIERFTSQQLIASGFAGRFERKSLLWWNADYAHHHFLERHPVYDVYIFIEWDALVLGDLQPVAEHIHRSNIDFLALPMRESKDQWCWTEPHLAVYPYQELQASLICISAFSRPALDHLARRRREMTAAAPPYWPIAEAFLPTEIRRAGLRWESLEDLGDCNSYDWSRPILEDSLPAANAPTFLHPVADQERFLRYHLETHGTLSNFLRPRSDLYRHLSNLPGQVWVPPVLSAAWSQGMRKLSLRAFSPQTLSNAQESPNPNRT